MHAYGYMMYVMYIAIAFDYRAAPWALSASSVCLPITLILN